MTIDGLQQFIARLEQGTGGLAYGVATSVWLVLSLSAWGLQRWALPSLKKLTRRSQTKMDDVIVEGMAQHIPAFLYLGAFILAFTPLSLPPWAAKGFRALTALWFLWAAVRLANGLARFVIFHVWLAGRGDENLTRKVHSLTPFLSVTLWVGGALLLLDNFGFKISAIVAGLGIGGVAVALASQAVLGDLFSYLAILFDKPFEPGDFIMVGDMMGTVERIGIKTTRLRSLGGEQLVFSNTDLTGSRVRNFKRLKERRILFRLGVTYDTPAAVLAQLPNRLRDIIASVPRTRFDRAHFASFGPSSLDFEVVYFVLSPEYNDAMDIQQSINITIKSEFDARKIEFAFPTQTLHIVPQSPPPNPATAR